MIVKWTRFELFRYFNMKYQKISLELLLPVQMVIVLSVIDLPNDLFLGFIGSLSNRVSNTPFFLGGRPFFLGGLFGQMESADQIGVLVPHGWRKVGPD